jgi:hypothetical protein
MRPGKVSKRILAWLLCFAMLTGNAQAISASDVTDADATVDEAVVADAEASIAEDETLSEASDEEPESDAGFVLIEAASDEETESTVETAEPTGEAKIDDSDDEKTDESSEATDDAITVSATAEDGAIVTVQGDASSFPKAGEYSLNVKRVTDEKELAEVIEDNDLTLSEYAAYDIDLCVDGEVVEPTGNVTVTFSGSLPIKSGKEQNVAVYHVDGDKLTEMESTSADADTQTVEMETDHFSTYIVGLSSDTSLTPVVQSDYVSVESKDEPDANGGKYTFEATSMSDNYRQGWTTYYNYYLNVRVYLDDKLVQEAPSGTSYFRYSSSNRSASTYTTDFDVKTDSSKYEISYVTKSYGDGQPSELTLSSSGLYEYALTRYNNGNKANYLNIYLTTKEDNSAGNNGPDSSTTITSEGVELDKTATLINWDDRTYNIQIDAQSKKIETTTTPATIDVMLVVDVSGTMGYRSDEYLGTYGEVKNSLDKNIIYTYIEPDNKNDPDTSTTCDSLVYVEGTGWKLGYANKGGEVWEDYVSSSYLEDDGDVYYSRLYKTQLALEKFIDTIATSSPESNIGLVTFSTSGELKCYGSLNSSKDELEKAIEDMRAKGYTHPDEGLEIAYDTLYSESANDNRQKYVIMFTDGVPSIKDGEFSEDLATAAKKSADKLKSTEESGLGATIYTIALSPTERAEQWLSEDIASSKDKAFSITKMSELQDKFKQISDQIQNGVPIEGATVTDIISAEFELTKESEAALIAAGATITKNATDGTTTIVWDDQVIPANKNQTYTFNVQAKDSFVGGNNIYTNDSSSNVLADGKTYTLPHPAVNVEEKLVVNSTEKTIFLGDTVPMNPTIMAELFTKQGTEDCTIEWYTDEACTNQISQDDMTKETPGVDGATYYLKVSYKADTPTEEALAASDGHYAGDKDDEYNITAIGTYTVHVVSGEITIQKTISKTTINSKQGDPIFTFKISDGTRSYYKTVRFSDTVVNNASGDTVSLSVTLSGLPKGNYTVEELDTTNYSVGSMTVDNGSATFDNSIDGNKVTFVAGDINKLSGKVSYVNVKKDNDTPKDTDVVKNTLMIGQKISDSKDGDN